MGVVTLDETIRVAIEEWFKATVNPKTTYVDFWSEDISSVLETPEVNIYYCETSDDWNPVYLHIFPGNLDELVQEIDQWAHVKNSKY